VSGVGHPVPLRAGVHVGLGDQVLLGVQEVPDLRTLLLQEPPEELAVHRAGQTHLLLVLMGGGRSRGGRRMGRSRVGRREEGVVIGLGRYIDLKLSSLE